MLLSRAVWICFAAWMWSWGCCVQAEGADRGSGAVSWWVEPPPVGSDEHDGTLNAPFATIQRGLEAAAPGDEVVVRAGRYKERVRFPRSGAPGQPIRLRGEGKPVIDASNRPPPNEPAGVVEIRVSHVALEDVVIEGWRSSEADAFPMGIFISSDTGAVESVSLTRVEVLGVRMLNKRSGAHGIGVYGVDPEQPIAGLTLTGCIIRDCRLGLSEAVALNGNVSGFSLVSNHVHGCDNIGIDVIGGERTSSRGTTDRARHGRIAGNRVENISTEGNPSYPKGDFSAGGIYVDGGSDIVIEQNWVQGCDLGIEVGPERPNWISERVTVRNNVVVNCRRSGLAIGGYSRKRGITRDSEFRHNTLIGNGTLNDSDGSLSLRKAWNNRISHNVIVGTGSEPIVASRLPPKLAFGHVMDWNVYSVESGAPQFQWQGRTVEGLAAFQEATQQETHSQVADPMLMGDFTTTNAAVVDAGDPAFVPDADERDFYGLPRRQFRVDIGATERPDPRPAPTPTNVPVLVLNTWQFDLKNPPRRGVRLKADGSIPSLRGSLTTDLAPGRHVPDLIQLAVDLGGATEPHWSVAGRLGKVNPRGKVKFHARSVAPGLEVPDVGRGLKIVFRASTNFSTASTPTNAVGVLVR